MAKQGRSSLMVRLGRIYQDVSPVWGFIDKIASKNTDHKAPFLCLLAPPRSGSTLTYQLLNEGLESFHLTNIWNVLYATPTIGGKVSDKISESYTTKYKSTYGFVPGLAGEAEGLKFWSHWTGQGMNQDNKFKKDKALKLESAINYLSSKNKKAFVSGFLGHVFCIKELKSIFKNIIFIHLQRDLLSNANSLYSGRKEIGFSTMPSSIKGMSLDDTARVAKQLVSIHTEIFANNDTNMITLNFSEVCDNPTTAIDKVISFAGNLGVSLKKNKKFIPPKDFKEKMIRKEDSLDAKKLYEALEKEIIGHNSENQLRSLLN